MSASETGSEKVIVIGDSPMTREVVAQLRGRGVEAVAVDEAPGYDRPRPRPRLRTPLWMAVAGMFGVNLSFPPPRPPRVVTPEDDERPVRAQAKRERKAASRRGAT